MRERWGRGGGRPAIPDPMARQQGAAMDGGGDAGPADISAAWALEFLVKRGLLSAADVLSGAPAAEEMSISHRSFCVRMGGRPRWFIKRADPVQSRGRDLGMEAAVYALAPRHVALAEVMPRCLLSDAGGGLLVLDAIAGTPLTAALQASADGGGPGRSAILRMYGDAVAQVHSARPPHFGQPPWLLVALEPRWGDFPWLPRGCASLLARLAASATVQAAFQEARRQWRQVCLIHGDLRWANALLDARGDRVKVWLVDWELACVGDPAWDVGSLLADVVATAAPGGGTPADEPLALCAPLLAGYRAAARATALSWAALVEHSVRLAGVRLVQTIIEHGHASEEELRRAEAALMPWTLRFLTQAHAIGSALATAPEAAPGL